MLMKYDHVFSNIFIFLFISKTILLVTAVNSASNNNFLFYPRTVSHHFSEGIDERDMACQQAIPPSWLLVTGKCTDTKPWPTKHDRSWKSFSTCYSLKQKANSVSIPNNQTGIYPINQLPNRGPHYADWGKFGEYDYIPPEVFVHNLVLGDAVFLYHPCAPSKLIESFKALGRNCTWRHIISPYSKVLNKTYPFGIVTFGCEYRMSSINVSDVQSFMKHRLNSPKSSIENGNFSVGLLNSSPLPKDKKTRDNEGFCQGIISDPPVMKTPRTEEAIWAAGSLVFLLSCLTCAVCYTRLWRRGNHGQSFEKSRVWNDETDPGSVSVAAIVRKFPHMLKNKVKETRRSRFSGNTQYRPIINEEEFYSEDEV